MYLYEITVFTHALGDNTRPEPSSLHLIMRLLCLMWPTIKHLLAWLKWAEGTTFSSERLRSFVMRGVEGPRHPLVDFSLMVKELPGIRALTGWDIW
jgi:hypothetical protein